MSDIFKKSVAFEFIVGGNMHIRLYVPADSCIVPDIGTLPYIDPGIDMHILTDCGQIVYRCSDANPDTVTNSDTRINASSGRAGIINARKTYNSGTDLRVTANGGTASHAYIVAELNSGTQRSAIQNYIVSQAAFLSHTRVSNADTGAGVNILTYTRPAYSIEISDDSTNTDCTAIDHDLITDSRATTVVSTDG